MIVLSTALSSMYVVSGNDRVLALGFLWARISE